MAFVLATIRKIFSPSLVFQSRADCRQSHTLGLLRLVNITDVRMEWYASILDGGYRNGYSTPYNGLARMGRGEDF